MRRRFILSTAIIALIIGYGCYDQKENTLNLDFERVDTRSHKPFGWKLNEKGYNVICDKDIVYSGRYSLRVKSITEQEVTAGYFLAGVLFDRIESNQRIRLSGSIRNEGTSCDSIGLWIQCKSSEQYVSKYSKSKNFEGSHDWQEYAIEIETPARPEYLMFGVHFSGGGVIWVDNLKLYIDNIRITDLPSSIEFKASKKEIEWLKQNCVPIKTVQSESGFGDLLPLKESLKNAKIIALGENTHGSGEIFEMKHRLLEFLSSEMGFNIFSIESAMFDTDQINNYVLNGKGDPKSLLKALTPVWNTQEVLNMITWMRKFNQNEGNHLQFTGFDIPPFFCPLTNLTNYAADHDRTLKDLVDSLKIILPYSNSYYQYLNNNKSVLQGIRKCDQILSYLGDIKDQGIIEQTQIEIMIQSATVIRQNLDYFSPPLSVARDKYMADNISWILEHNPDSKIVIWAHNEHISKNPQAMGKFLAERYGNQYYSIGFLSNKGKYTAGTSEFTISTENKLAKGESGSFEYNFNKTGLPVFFLDLHSLDTDNPQANWLSGRLYQSIIGGNATDDQFWPVYLKDKFDGIIFIKSTNPSKLFLPIENN